MGNLQLCDSTEKLFDFLQGIDTCMPTPLHKIVDLKEYAEKIMHFGQAAVIMQAGQVVCAACFYCNDQQTKCAYLSLLGTLPGYEGQGYASSCLSLAEQHSAANGMVSLRLDAVPENTRAVRFYQYHNYQIERADQKLHFVKDL